MKYSLMILLVCFSVGVSNAQKKNKIKRTVEKLEYLQIDYYKGKSHNINISLWCYYKSFCYVDMIKFPTLAIKIPKPEKQNEAYKLLVYNQPDLKAFNFVNDWYLFNVNRK